MSSNWYNNVMWCAAVWLCLCFRVGVGVTTKCVRLLSRDIVGFILVQLKYQCSSLPRILHDILSACLYVADMVLLPMSRIHWSYEHQEAGLSNTTWTHMCTFRLPLKITGLFGSISLGNKKSSEHILVVWTCTTYVHLYPPRACIPDRIYCLRKCPGELMPNFIQT